MELPGDAPYGIRTRVTALRGLDDGREMAAPLRTRRQSVPRTVNCVRRSVSNPFRNWVSLRRNLWLWRPQVRRAVVQI